MHTANPARFLATTNLYVSYKCAFVCIPRVTTMTIITVVINRFLTRVAKNVFGPSPLCVEKRASPEACAHATRELLSHYYVYDV